MDTAFEELKHKQVINITNGHRLGFVREVETDADDERLLALRLPGEGGTPRHRKELIIPWTCIEHIGDEIIVVNLKEP